MAPPQKTVCAWGLFSIITSTMNNRTKPKFKLLI